MKSGLSTQQLIEEVKEFAQKLSSGHITAAELDQFVEATSALHHKAVILRYKAFENKVLGKEQPLVLPEDNLEESATTQASVEYHEPAVDMQVIENEIPEPVEVAQPKTETPAEAPEPAATAETLQSELTMAHEEDEPAFDLFSLDLNDKEDTADAPREELPASADEGQASALEMEEAEAATGVHAPVEPVRPQPESAPAPQPSYQHAETRSSLHAIYNRIDRPDDSFASRFAVNRIENLNVAFGFNERLQTINDLFNGSSEVFAAAINELQQAPSREQARMIVSRYADKNSWNASDDLAISFAKKVDQLYA